MTKKMRDVLVGGRDLALVYQGGQEASGRLILSVEADAKWYDIYAVSPSGLVLAIPQAVAGRYERENPGMGAWGDHVPCPQFCDWIVAQHPECQWDDRSLGMVRTRWNEHLRGA